MRRNPMRTPIIVAAALVFGASSTEVLAQPRTVSTERRFEVASVKPVPSPAELGRLAAQSGAGFQLPANFGIQTRPGGRFTAGTVTLKQLIAEAFDVKDYQIDGGPKWLTTDYFEITANAGADATPADVKAMLRTLLTERFSLRTHTDTRQAPVHVLTVSRSDGRLGSRLTRATPECVQQIEQRKTGTAPPSKPQTASELNERMKRMMSGDSSVTPICGTSMMGSRANGASTLAYGGMELKSLVSRISSELSALVIDRTELSGLFDVSLEYLSERTMNGRAAGLDPNSTEPLPPPLVGALQQQLGLKLEKQIGPMPIVVIDAAEHPTPD